MKSMRGFLLLAGALVAGIGVAYAQYYAPPQVTSIGATDLFQDIVQGNAQAGNYYASAPLLGTYSQTLAGGNALNLMIGADFSTNLFQRGTSISAASSTYYVTYGPDRWFVWGGTSTPVTISRQSDAPPGYLYSAQVNKGSLTGVKQVCVSQIVEGVNVYAMQGKAAEFDVHLKAGPTFSAAASSVTMTVSYGTVADEGSTLYAYGLNTQGGAGTTAWTGQVNTTVTVPISTTWTRYTIVAPIGTTAAEAAVAICYTPVGTGTSTDWFEFDGAQLTPNQSLVPLAVTGGTLLQPNDTRAKAFARRPVGLETALQQRYYYQVNEPAANVAVSAGGTYYQTTTCLVPIPLPATMRIAPTATFGTLDTTHWAIVGASATPYPLATTYLVQSALGVNTPNVLALTATTAAKTAGFGCVLVGAGGAAGGFIAASAEL